MHDNGVCEDTRGQVEGQGQHQQRIHATSRPLGQGRGWTATITGMDCEREHAVVEPSPTTLRPRGAW